ncbi:MAG: DUF116 domain-containing protein [Thermoanaerobacterales bacterium]|nr:DUF116 domain-containing protein [Thermoanaerobacterales bacterium]
MPYSVEQPTKIKKRIFIGLLAASAILILVMIFAGVFIYYNKMGNWYRYVLLFIVMSMSLFLIIMSIGLAAVVMTLLQAKSFFGFQDLMNRSIRLLFPLAILLGGILHIPKDLIKSSFIEVNNKLVQTRTMNIPPSKVLILAPHCLQRWDCNFKITADVSNCRHCGRCDINDLWELSQNKGVNLAVVTGGTLARKMVADHKPRAIVAIACERDLTDGILDINSIPVIGVLNIRPEGPCKNTKVSVYKVAEAVNFFINGNSFNITGRSNQQIGKPSRTGA